MPFSGKNLKTEIENTSLTRQNLPVCNRENFEAFYLKTRKNKDDFCLNYLADPWRLLLS